MFLVLPLCSVERAAETERIGLQLGEWAFKLNPILLLYLPVYPSFAIINLQSKNLSKTYACVQAPTLP